MVRDHGSEADGAPSVTHRMRRWWRPWKVSVAIGVGLVALVVGLLALPGGTLVGDTTTNIKITASLPALDKTHTLIQPLVASQDRLTRIYITFGTFGGTARSCLHVDLRERPSGAAPGTGPVVASRDLPCTGLPDTGPFKVIEVPPIARSAGRTYDVVVTRVDSGDGKGAVVWAGIPRGAAQVAIIAGNTAGLSADVRPEYDPEPHRWDHLVTTMRRLAAYGPDWGSPWVYGGLVVVMLGLLALGPVVLRRRRTLVVVVAALALLRGLVWAASIPQLEAMDEPAHFAYVQYLAEEKAFPGKVADHEWFSPRLQATVDDLNVESTPPGDRPSFIAGADVSTEAALRSLSPQGGGGGPGTMYAPFYYIPAAVLYLAGGGNILTQIMLARLWSVVMGVLAAGILVVLGRQLFPRRRAAQWAFVVAGLFQPMIAHQFAIVNNDAWVITAGFAALSVGLALAKGRRSAGLALLAGVIIGAALLGKPFGIACAVPLAVGWVVGKVRAREHLVRVYLREAVLVVVGVASTYGAWTLAAERMGLTTSAVPAHQAVGQSLSGFWDAQFGHQLDAARAIWGDQLWGDFGWVRVPLPPPIRLALFVIELVLLLGLVVWVVVLVVQQVRRRLRIGEAGEVVRVPVAEEDAGGLPLDVRILMTAATIVGTVGTLYAAGYVYYMATGLNNLLQGRYALLALPAILAAPALLVERFTGGRVKPIVVNSLAAFGMVSVNLLGLVLVQEAFYG